MVLKTEQRLGDLRSLHNVRSDVYLEKSIAFAPMIIFAFDPGGNSSPTKYGHRRAEEKTVTHHKKSYGGFEGGSYSFIHVQNLRMLDSHS